MSQTAKLFQNGRSQAVRLPANYRFAGDEVFIRRDAETGDVILSRKPEDWSGFVKAVKQGAAPEDFLNASERAQATALRDPFVDE